MLLNADYSNLEQKLFDLSKRVLSTTSKELYDCEYIKGSKTLRVYICDKETKNAVIEDCVEVDNAFTEFIESEDWIPDDFVLEVSSPGVYRNLKTVEHFQAAVGEFVRIKFKPGKSHEDFKNKKQLRGKLLEFNDKELKLEINGDKLSIAFDELLKATLDPDTV